MADLGQGTASPRETRIAATILGTIGAVMGGATAVAAVYFPRALAIVVIPVPRAAGLVALVLSILAAVAAGEASAHPRGAGAVMVFAGLGGFAVVGAYFAVAAVLLAMAGVMAIVVPPEHPHHDLPRRLRLGS